MSDPDRLLASLGVDESVPRADAFFLGGESEAASRFRRFLDTSLPVYAAHRNQPQFPDVSGMSPYLHFGQVSPVRLALEAMARRDAHPQDVDVFVEELVIRRELAMNHARHAADPGRYASLPTWARRTLEAHADDFRDAIYSPDQLEAAATHDPYWNAAMTEMKLTGFMHNYMRMYWGKKVLEWSPTPAMAYETLLRLNDRYFLDGRDPNSLAGVGWVFGLHDRPWKERSVYGMVRCMTAGGLKRKCDIEGYARRVGKAGHGHLPR